ncbi:MAG: hypothetical protein AAGL98_04925 [Planctomycetota bacterium]
MAGLDLSAAGHHRILLGSAKDEAGDDVEDFHAASMQVGKYFLRQDAKMPRRQEEEEER